MKMDIYVVAIETKKRTSGYARATLKEIEQITYDQLFEYARLPEGVEFPDNADGIFKWLFDNDEIGPFFAEWSVQEIYVPKLSELRGALSSLLHQVEQMQGLFDDSDGTIAEAVDAAEKALSNDLGAVK
ncbi:MAG: hypothetical protein AAF429_09095 [Pseudomonadota bacterium]